MYSNFAVDTHYCVEVSDLLQTHSGTYLNFSARIRSNYTVISQANFKMLTVPITE